MPSVLNTDLILSVPNATGVPNVPTVPNVLKMTINDPSVPRNYLVYQQKHLVYQPVYQTQCSKVHQMHQNSLGMMHSALNTDPLLSVQKCNWCTKRNEGTNCTQNDREQS